jgi:hypothetical protein
VANAANLPNGPLQLTGPTVPYDACLLAPWHHRQSSIFADTSNDSYAANVIRSKPA